MLQEVYKQALMYSSVAFSVGGIIGAILFGVEDTIFTLSSAYGFYWFVTLMSLSVSLGGVVFHNMQSALPQKLLNVCNLYMISSVSFVMLVLWLSAAATVGNILSVCMYMKNELHVDVKCNGLIVATTFGFAEFLVWSVVSFFLSTRLYNTLVPAQSGTQV